MMQCMSLLPLDYNEYRGLLKRYVRPYVDSLHLQKVLTDKPKQMSLLDAGSLKDMLYSWRSFAR